MFGKRSWSFGLDLSLRLILGQKGHKEKILNLFKDSALSFGQQ